jgi:hypothetical protein
VRPLWSGNSKSGALEPSGSVFGVTETVFAAEAEFFLPAEGGTFLALTGFFATTRFLAMGLGDALARFAILRLLFRENPRHYDEFAQGRLSSRKISRMAPEKLCGFHLRS